MASGIGVMEYLNRGTGALPSPVDIRDYKLKKTAKDLPKEFFIKDIPIKNQGGSPTCVAHVLSEIVEFHTYKDNMKYNQFSTEFIYGCRDSSKYKEEGMYLREGLKVLSDYGDVLYSDLKGNSDTAEKANQRVWENFEELTLKAAPYKISAYYKISTLKELKTAIYADGPVAASLKWYKCYKIHKGLYVYNSNSSYTPHAVLVVGWTDNCLILQNSWGKYWGDKGYFLVPIDDMKNLFYEFYGVTDNIESIVRPSIFKRKTAPLANKAIQKVSALKKR